jgi:hypothetical protein
MGNELMVRRVYWDIVDDIANRNEGKQAWSAGWLGEERKILADAAGNNDNSSSRLRDSIFQEIEDFPLDRVVQGRKDVEQGVEIFSVPL